MALVYTLGEWQVRAGAEEEFVAAWREFAEWTDATVSGNGWAKLLQDREDPQRFVSFGPWVDDDAVSKWRTDPGFQERVGRIQGLLESFVPRRLGVAAESGAATPDP